MLLLGWRMEKEEGKRYLFDTIEGASPAERSLKGIFCYSCIFFAVESLAKIDASVYLFTYKFPQ